MRFFYWDTNLYGAVHQIVIVAQFKINNKVDTKKVNSGDLVSGNDQLYFIFEGKVNNAKKKLCKLLCEWKWEIW